MPGYRVETPQRCYPVIVERGAIGQAARHIPQKTGKVFVVTTEDVWRHAGDALEAGLAGVAHDVLHLPGGEDQKRLMPLERLAAEMVQRGGDRSSLVIAHGGGSVKNRIGSFHQPLAVLTDPAVLDTLPNREFRAGLYEILKAGMIREPALF